MLRALLLGLAMAWPSFLAGQACLGTPATGRVVLGGGVGRETGDATRVSLETMVGMSAGTAIRAQYDRTRFAEPDTPDRHRVGLGVTLPEVAGVPLCATASATHATLGDLDVWYLPVGLALGVDLPLVAHGVRVRSYVEPRLGWRQATLLGFRMTKVSGSVVAGSGLTRGRVYGGVAVEWLPAERSHWATGVRLAVGL